MTTPDKFREKARDIVDKLQAHQTGQYGDPLIQLQYIAEALFDTDREATERAFERAEHSLGDQLCGHCLHSKQRKVNKGE